MRSSLIPNQTAVIVLIWGSYLKLLLVFSVPAYPCVEPEFPIVSPLGLLDSTAPAVQTLTCCLFEASVRRPQHEFCEPHMPFILSQTISNIFLKCSLILLSVSCSERHGHFQGLPGTSKSESGICLKITFSVRPSKTLPPY